MRIPQHVVYRSLASETVVLNIQTGTYYGLNFSAGRMLEALERTADFESALARLVAEFDDVAEHTLRADLTSLCADLEAKDLITLGA